MTDESKKVLARVAAIDIAAANMQTSLVDDLVRIALAPDQPMPLRESAGHAVRRIGDRAARGRQKPLALGQAGDDLDPISI